MSEQIAYEWFWLADTVNEWREINEYIMSH